MIHFNIQGRGSGKTYNCILKMQAHPHMIMIIQNRRMRSLYPKDIQDRIFTMDELLENGLIRERSRHPHHLPETIIDEGLTMDPVTMAKLYYKLGQSGYDVEVWGSLPGEMRQPRNKNIPYSR